MHSPYIWVPKFRLVEPDLSPIKRRVLTSGHFSLRGSLPDGRNRAIAQEQPNLILNTGLDRWGTGTPVIYAAVGNSNQSPQVTDTAIVSFVAQHDTLRSNTRGVQSSPPYYGWRRWVFRFNPPGSNRTLREVTTGWGQAGESAWARSLIKDENGNPLDVTWLSNETLDFTYEVRFYPFGLHYDEGGGVVLDDTQFEIVCNGVTHSGKIRPADLTNSDGGWSFENYAATLTKSVGAFGPALSPKVTNGGIGLVTGTPSGTQSVQIQQGWSEDQYVLGSHKRTGAFTFGPEQGNLTGGITAVLHQTNVGSYQFDLDPAIQKVEDWSLTLGMETPTWQRYTP